MNQDEISKVICSIICNETRPMQELTNSELAGYLTQNGIDDTKEHIEQLREAF